MAIFATFTRRLFIVLNLFAAFLFLLACANMYINPAEWWFIAMLGLFFPFMIVVHVIFIIGWLFVRSKWALLSFVVLLVGYSNIRALVGISFMADYSSVKAPGTLRLLSWNVHQFGFSEGQTAGLITRRKIVDYIKEQDADVLCLQEFIKDIPAGTKHVSIFELLKNIGYPYSFFSEDYIQSRGKYAMGVAIFSRYPIRDSFRIRYSGEVASMSAETLLAADILFEKKPVRIFTTHLQSNRLAKEEYVHVTSRRGDKDSVLIASKTIAKKLRQAYRFRSEQADKVAAALNSSPHPEIIAGDFNDIPNSYTYFQLVKDRQDAFREKGWGLGRTFSHISPTLRIDYIMADKRFEVLQYKRRLLPYSDHYPIIADLRFREQ
jgi:endonuclease/exonuclease/phosphatase family metal-dependent hydrolase